MDDFDAIIVGGGMQGLMAALECVRRGRRPLVVEADKLGEGATGTSLGIVHGGLRYLQALDVRRWRRSRGEQLWFARNFPGHVAPLRCVMPLYRGSPRSPLLFRAAFAAQAAARHLARLNGNPGACGFLSAAEVRDRYAVPTRDLTGAAFWDELVIPDSQTLLRAIAGRVVAQGGTVIEQESAAQLLCCAGRATGIATRPAGGHETNRYRAPVVLVCAGAASQAVAARFDRHVPQLSARMLAFNLLIDRPLPGPEALAVSPTPGRGRSLFLRPHAAGTLVGTGYCPAPERTGSPGVPQHQLRAFLADLGRALPGFAGSQPIETLAGRLPDNGRRTWALRERDFAWDHGRHGGPKGLYTLTATKLTTAHAHAREVLDRIWPRSEPSARRRSAPRPTADFGQQLQWRSE